MRALTLRRKKDVPKNIQRNSRNVSEWRHRRSSVKNGPLWNTGACASNRMRTTARVTGMRDEYEAVEDLTPCPTCGSRKWWYEG